MQTHTIELDGAITFWSLGTTSRQMVADLFERLSFGDLTPDYQSDRQALKAAMESIRSRHQRVESLKSPKHHGYELVDIERGEDSNFHIHNFSARVDDTGRVEVRGGWYDRDKLQALWAEQKAKLTPSSVSRALVSILGRLDAVVLRGGLYWVPSRELPRWSEVAEGIEAAGEQDKTRIHLADTALTERTARTLRDALVDEVVKASAEIQERINVGNLDDVALETQKVRACRLRQRVGRYAEILGEWQQRLEAVIHLAEQSAVRAAILGMPSMVCGPSE